MKIYLLFISLAAILTLPLISCSGDYSTQNETDPLLDSENWAIDEFSNDHFLYFKTNPEFRAVIEFNSGGAEVREVSPITNDARLAAVIYYSGSAGTHQIVEIYRAVLLNTLDREVLGDFPWEYRTDNGLTQPEWSLSDDKKRIRITDPSSGLDRTVETGI